MPFPNQNPVPFTLAGVMSLTPNQAGCYGIFSGNQWVYVGRGDIRTRLLDHLSNSTILAQNPTHFVTVLHAKPELLEKALILECQPYCNQKVG